MVTNYTSVLGKKIQFGYTWLSPIMCSNPFLLKASHVYFVTVIYDFPPSHFKKVYFAVLCISVWKSTSVELVGHLTV